MKVWILQLVLVSLVAPLAAVDAPHGVVVSVEPLRWLVEEIGGERVEVEVLVSPGESPTSFQPTDAQVTRLMRARVFFRIGVPFENGLWFDAVRSMGRFVLVDLRQGIEIEGGDPHIWLSPRLLSIQATTVAESLTLVDPDRRSLYESNLQLLQDRLATLDGNLRSALEPYAGRSFLVFHPSWGYFAEAYGLRQIAVEIDGREPSDRELTDLQAEARELRLTTLFVQPQIHGRGARAMADSLGVEIEVLDPLAADVVANLAYVTQRLEASFQGGGGLEH